MLKNLKSKTLATISLIITFLFSMTGTVFAKEITPSLHYDYVALGDSLAAGQTPYGDTKSYGYTNIIHNMLAKVGVPSNYQNFGVSGLKSQELLTQLTSNPKMQKFISNAEIVTLDIGANDILPLVEGYFKASTNLDKLNLLTQIQAKMQEVSGNIFHIISIIHEINPNTKIYVMGYYNALINYLTPDQQKYEFLPLLKGFNDQIQLATTLSTNTKNPSNKAVYVDTMGYMDNHSEYLPGDIHPTVEGYRAIANAFWDIIKVDFLITSK